jgi:hypothetical protein
VAYGHDFVGDAYDGTNSFAEDSDPMDNCNGHGTHVAGRCDHLIGKSDRLPNIYWSLGTGIIGAHDPESGFVGVAPDGINFSTCINEIDTISILITYDTS